MSVNEDYNLAMLGASVPASAGHRLSEYRATDEQDGAGQSQGDRHDVGRNCRPESEQVEETERPIAVHTS